MPNKHERNKIERYYRNGLSMMDLICFENRHIGKLLIMPNKHERNKIERYYRNGLSMMD
jgi:hypothetical protein